MQETKSNQTNKPQTTKLREEFLKPTQRLYSTAFFLKFVTSFPIFCDSPKWGAHGARLHRCLWNFAPCNTTRKLATQRKLFLRPPSMNAQTWSSRHWNPKYWNQSTDPGLLNQNVFLSASCPFPDSPRYFTISDLQCQNPVLLGLYICRRKKPTHCQNVYILQMWHRREQVTGKGIRKQCNNTSWHEGKTLVIQKLALFCKH